MTAKRKLDTGIVKMRPQQRYFRLSADPVANSEVPIGVVDLQTRTVTFSFSSETPVDMWFGEEILSHASGSARLDRINSGGPLLFNHDMDDLLGVVEKAWIGTDLRGYCTVRFGQDDRGVWAMGQVQDKILQNVSFLYQVHVFETDNDTDVYTATDWEPYEISLVTVPADTSVGVGRSVSNEELDVQVNRPQTSSITPPAFAENTQQGNEAMTIKQRKVVMNAVIEGSTGGGAAVVADPAVIESARVAEIEAMCKTHKISDETRGHLISLKQPIEAARGIVMDELLARNKGNASLGGSSNPDMTEKEKAKYSMIRAINASINERMGNANAWKDAGFEREVSQDIGKRTGRATAGLYLPTNLAFASRSADYSYGTGSGLSATSGGSNIVATNLLAGSFIDMLRNKARVFNLGAQMLSGLVGNIDIPRQKAAGQVYWNSEGVPMSQTGAQFDQVQMSPHQLGALSVITRNMLQQSTPDVEMLARADLIATMALGIDAAVLWGTGANGQPLGVANQPNINSVIGGTNGAAPTIDNLIDMETLVCAANADGDRMAYLTNPRVVGALKKLKSTTGEYLWTNSPLGNTTGTPGEVNGYSVARTNQARSNLTKGTSTNVSEIYFGDWSQILVGEWGVVEILPNPYAAGIYEAGGVELRILQTIDVGVRHQQSFSVMSDAIA